ncbi:MAG: hypothetical protein AMS27_08715 [Bacteroides sp. SM23_62_1]|nr:MAG: hypothetical protein AMS27_08715 [Bacteroides sp. SM23_62_1]
MDERNKLIAYKVIAFMYFITLLALIGVTLVRQFVQKQEVSEFEDIAIIVTINTLFLISGLLYFGAIPIQKLKIKTILLGYGLLVVSGSLFTYAKYNIFLKLGLSFKQLLDKMIIIITVSGIIVLFFVFFSFLGIRRIKKELKE